ncbi:MAG TPA: hypothetical protein P5513_04525 [Candidatus Diapherotrites archaeon]|nr:hypothetical protein [Candidatus Diapherotrites archaeon]
MAKIQPTFVSGSLWIGTGSSAATIWDAYSGVGQDSIPFAIYDNNARLLYATKSISNTHSLTFTTRSYQQSEYFNSAYPMGYGYKIWSEDIKFPDNSTSSIWKAIFDDITVRGQLNVW